MNLWMAYEWHKMAVSCVSELDLQNSVDNCIDTRKQTKLFQDVMFAWLFAALVGKNIPACCSHCSSHCSKFRLVISLVFCGFSQPEDMFVLMMINVIIRTNMSSGWENPQKSIKVLKRNMPHNSRCPSDQVALSVSFRIRFQVDCKRCGKGRMVWKLE